MTNAHAVALGKLGGSKKSDKKTEASRKNWKKSTEALAKKRAEGWIPGPKKNKNNS